MNGDSKPPESETQQPQPPDSSTELVPRGSFAQDKTGLSFQTLQEAWWFATKLSQSSFVPELYRGKPGDCLIAMDLALRLRSSVLAVLQNTYVVHGRPGMEAKFVLGLINSSGLFTDPLDYEVSGDDPFDESYRVRAYATRKSTGKVLYGPWIGWKLVKAEGWNADKPWRNGKGMEISKWNTMPDVMFHYRAASWFANRHCPDLKLGMHTTDELYDIGDRKMVESTEVKPPVGNEAVKAKLAALSQQEEPPPEPSTTATNTAATVPIPEEAPASPAPEMGDLPWDGPTQEEYDAEHAAPTAATTKPIDRQYVCTRSIKHVFTAMPPGEKCPHCKGRVNEILLKF